MALSKCRDPEGCVRARGGCSSIDDALECGGQEVHRGTRAELDQRSLEVAARLGALARVKAVGSVRQPGAQLRRDDAMAPPTCDVSRELRCESGVRAELVCALDITRPQHITDGAGRLLETGLARPDASAHTNSDLD